MSIDHWLTQGEDGNIDRKTDGPTGREGKSGLRAISQDEIDYENETCQ